MTPFEFHAARRALGASINEMAVLLNTESRTIRRYEDGSRSPGGSTVQLIEALLDGWRPRR